MKKSKILAMGLCGVMLVSILSACNGKQPTVSGTPSGSSSSSVSASAEKSKISIIRPGDQAKVESFMKPAIAKFMSDNPNITVEVVYESWAGWIQKYPTLFGANTQPDVIFWWDNKLNDAAARPKLVDLTNYVDKSVFDSISPSIWNLVSIGGTEKYYVPSSVDPFVLYYNKDVFTKAGLDPNNPPKTWDELLAACKAIKEKTGLPGIGIPAKTGMETLEEFVGHFVTQMTDTAMLDSKSQPLFNNALGLQAMEFLGKLWPYVQASPTDFGRGELRPLLRDGQIGMLLDSAWAIPTFTAKFGVNLDTSVIGVATPPLGPNGKKIAWAGTNGWIATRTETAAASGKLISFMMSDEQLLAHHVAYGSAPLLPSELSQDVFKYNYWKTFSTVLTDYELFGMIGKNSATPSAYYAGLEEVWQKFLVGQLKPQAAIDAAVEKVKAINAR